jgi:pentatricopeptide repeat protein
MWSGGYALIVFRQIGEIDYISWNSMLACYVQNGLYAEAIDFFGEMLRYGLQPDHACVVSLSLHWAIGVG